MKGRGETKEAKNRRKHYNIENKRCEEKWKRQKGFEIWWLIEDKNTSFFFFFFFLQMGIEKKEKVKIQSNNKSKEAEGK